MALAERQANVIWQGDLAHGNGTVHVNSGAFPDFPVTWASRTQRSDGKTSPEELIAAAHASCFAMAFSNTLATNGATPEQLDVTAVCTLDRVDDKVRITTMRLTVRGHVPGLDADAFQRYAQQAAEGCPVSNALHNNVDIQLDAQLA